MHVPTRHPARVGLHGGERGAAGFVADRGTGGSGRGASRDDRVAAARGVVADELFGRTGSGIRRRGDGTKEFVRLYLAMLAFGGVIWAVRVLGRWTLRMEAMGFGDVTLMAMIGTYMGWQASLVVFFLAPLA